MRNRESVVESPFNSSLIHLNYLTLLKYTAQLIHVDKKLRMFLHSDIYRTQTGLKWQICPKARIKTCGVMTVKHL